MDRRDQLSQINASEKNRLQKAPPSIIKDIKRSIRFFDKEITKVEAQITKLIAQNQELKEQADLMTSIKGVGKVTTWAIIAYLQEINTLSRNQTVALVTRRANGNWSGGSMMTVRSKS